MSFWDHARSRPDDPAMMSGDGVVFTFAEAARLADRVATVFAEAGASPGDTVSLVGGNEPMWMITYLAALQSGLYFTPLAPGASAADLAAIWSDSGTRVVVAGAGHAPWTDRAAEEAGIAVERRFSLTGAGPFQDLRRAAEAVPGTAVPPARRAGIRSLYTGGTTGAPKRISRALPAGTPEQAAADVIGGAPLLGMRPGESRHLVAGPLYHGGPLAFATSALHLGATLVMPATWDAEQALRLIAEHRVASTFMVPTMLARLVNLPDEIKERYDVTSLETIVHGAAPCPPALKHRLMEWLGPVLYEFYAATEGGGTYVTPQDWLEHPGTVGRPFPGQAVRVVDEDGVEVPRGTVGRITMLSSRGDGTSYFWPGDVGYLDEEGWLFLTDRVADVIITGGVNVYSTQVEAGLSRFDEIEQCAVVGVPDPDWGEAVTAVVVPRPGSAVPDLEARLREFAVGVLAPSQRPKHVVLTDALPHTAAGKVDKRALRRQYADLSGAGEAR